jgi:CHAT domain-containing protein/Tfp pilus assembly protein PilF
MITTLRAFAGGLLLLAVPIAAAGPREPVAIVYQVSGEPLRIAPGRSPEPLRFSDRLPAGAAMELKAGSRLALAFVTGKRYELSGPARATLGEGDLTAKSGGVRALASVPPLPRLAPIAESEKPGAVPGAITIRGGEAGSGSFSKEDIEARERLRKAVEALGDDDSRALLKAVDHVLGLTDKAPEDPEPPGAVVEVVTPESPAETAGLRPGDVILSWSCAAAPPGLPQPSSGDVRSPYGLLSIEIEQAPRRAVVLHGKRGDQEMAWRFSAGEWGVRMRPVMAAGLAALYLQGKAGREAGDLAATERSWRAAAESARAAGEGRFAAWLLDQLARAFGEAGKWTETDGVCAQALAALKQESETLAAAELLRFWGKMYVKRAAWDTAGERFQQALALNRSLAAKSLAEAKNLDAWGIASAKRGDFSTAEKLMQQALAIREELAPGTAEVTGSLNNLGILAGYRGDLDAKEKYLTRGEEIQRRLAPESDDEALLLQNLGNLAGVRGDLTKAEALCRQALAIFEKNDPNGNGVILVESNLANITMLRGNLAEAGELLQHVLALQERKAPEPLETAKTLISLGNLASRRGDLDASEAYYRQALDLQEKVSPDGSGGADSFANLGNIAALRGDFNTARIYLERSLAIKEKSAPESLDTAQGMERVARLQTDSGGDLAKAEELLRHALKIYESQALESLQTAEILRGLGEVLSRRGHPSEALSLHHRSLHLQHKLAPGSTEEAEALYFLAVAEQRGGQPGDATQRFCEAVDVLDRQRARVGDTQEARTSFEASLGGYYYACLDNLARQGRPGEAFHILERGRARSFLSLLAERDIHLQDLPPELATERKHLDAEYDRVQSQLARLNAGKDDQEIDALPLKLRDLRTHQEEILARIRRESPRAAALQDPQPPDLAGARAALDPGTVLLEYAVGAERTWLFAVQAADVPGPGLSIFRIDAGEKTLRKEVESFRLLLRRPGSGRAALQARARHLYRLLVRPAETRIAGAQRLLASPDGPLRTLPFAALMRGDRYLVEWKPIHSVLSAAVYAELKRSRPAQRDLREERVDAFGYPTYPRLTPGGSPDPVTREVLRRGWALTPLPSTRKEVESIAAIFPKSHEYLGRDATEEKAKSLGPDSGLIHFACHGLLDERFPLNSALALTLPEHPAEGQDNGLLQAWEIFERMHLDADLVTLSACDTALGKEMGGEGLVGLTRAFQYAGARSVLASLWGVADYSTARFMKRFYGYLRGGKTKDEALRAAQIDQIRKKGGSSHPFFWAAFELNGDWR